MLHLVLATVMYITLTIQGLLQCRFSQGSHCNSACSSMLQAYAASAVNIQATLTPGLRTGNFHLFRAPSLVN